MPLMSFVICAGSTVTLPKLTSGRTTPKLRSTRSSARGTPSLTPRLTPTGSPTPQSKKGSPLPSMHALDSQIESPTSLPTSRSGSRSSSPSRVSRQRKEVPFRKITKNNLKQLYFTFGSEFFEHFHL